MKDVHVHVHTFSGLTSTIPTPAQPWLWPAASLAVPLKYNQNGNFADPIIPNNPTHLVEMIRYLSNYGITTYLKNGNFFRVLGFRVGNNLISSLVSENF
jgi:hypothetical protein